jgi:hypothetical protein
VATHPLPGNIQPSQSIGFLGAENEFASYEDAEGQKLIFAQRKGLPLVGLQIAPGTLTFLAGVTQLTSHDSFTQSGRRGMQNPILWSGVSHSPRGRMFPGAVFLPALNMTALGRPVSTDGFTEIPFIPDGDLTEENILTRGYRKFLFSAGHLVGNGPRMELDPAISQFQVQYPPFDNQIYKVFDLSSFANRIFLVTVLKTPTPYYYTDANVNQFAYRAVVLDGGQPKELRDSAIHNGGPGFLEVKTDIGTLYLDRHDGDYFSTHPGGQAPRTRVTADPLVPKNTDASGLAKLGLVTREGPSMEITISARN